MSTPTTWVRVYPFVRNNNGRQVFDDGKNVYRDQGWNLWRLAFVAGTNAQSLHLLVLLVFAVTGRMEWYLYAFTTIAACEIVAFVYRRLQGAREGG